MRLSHNRSRRQIHCISVSIPQRIYPCRKNLIRILKKQWCVELLHTIAFLSTIGTDTLPFSTPPTAKIIHCKSRLRPHLCGAYSTLVWSKRDTCVEREPHKCGTNSFQAPWKLLHIEPLNTSITPSFAPLLPAWLYSNEYLKIYARHRTWQDWKILLVKQVIDDSFQRKFCPLQWNAAFKCKVIHEISRESSCQRDIIWRHCISFTIITPFI